MRQPLLVASLSILLAVAGTPSAANAQAKGRWELQRVETVKRWVVPYFLAPETKVWDENARGPFSGGFSIRKPTGDRVVNLSVSIPGLPGTLKPGDWLSFDAKVTGEINGPGPDTAYVTFYERFKTATGLEGSGFASMEKRVGVGGKQELGWGIRNTQLQGSFPNEDFIWTLRASLDDTGPGWAREAVAIGVNMTIELHYKWIPATAGDVAETRPERMGPREEGTSLTGTNLTYYQEPTIGACDAACAKDPKCKGYSWIRAGTYNPTDAAMCYLVAVVTGRSKAAGHTSAVKIQ